MKKILLATTVLVGTAGFAAAEVTLSGSARMGIVSGYDAGLDDMKAGFSSRIRVNFGLAGETDGGLSFGASVRADQAGTANSGGTAMDAGSVFVSGAFGKISMGDNDSAANATVGHVDGVGYTGNGDFNEIAYIGQTDTSVLYTYAAGDLSVAASVGQLDAETNYDGDAVQAYSVAAAYTFGNYKVMGGYEVGQKTVYSYLSQADANDSLATDSDNDGSTSGADGIAGNADDETWWDRYDLTNHLVLGGDATFGDFTVKARLGKASGEAYSSDDIEATQYALSGTYKMDAISVTAFAAKFDITSDSYDYTLATNRYGIGAGYDLGGGASASVGYSHYDHDLTGSSNNGEEDWSDNKWEAGVNFSF